MGKWAGAQATRERTSGVAREGTGGRVLPSSLKVDGERGRYGLDVAVTSHQLIRASPHVPKEI